jgi:hypothetical protein
MTNDEILFYQFVYKLMKDLDPKYLFKKKTFPNIFFLAFYNAMNNNIRQTK